MNVLFRAGPSHSHCHACMVVRPTGICQAVGPCHHCFTGAGLLQAAYCRVRYSFALYLHSCMLRVCIRLIVIRY